LNKSKSLASLMVLMLLANLFLVLPPVGARTGPRSPADITVTNLQVPTGLLFKGDNITITATIKNLGTLNATKVSVQFEAWNNTLTKPIDLGTNNSLGHDNGGANLTSNIPVQVTVHWNTSQAGKGVAGGLVYSINVTAYNASDAGPNNNIMRTNVQFLDDAYLIVAKVTPSATSVAVGAQFSISYKVTNIGTKTENVLGDNLQLYLDKAAVPLEYQAIQGLAPQQSAQGMFIPNTSAYFPGNHTFRLQLQNAGRNATTGNIMFLAPNPYVSKLEWWPLNGKVGDKITVNATINNNGTSDAKDLAVHFYVDQPYLISAYDAQVNVTAGGTYISRFLWDTTGLAVGNHTVKASLRPVWSSDKLTSNITLKVGGVADLAVISLVLTPNSVDIGETVNITVSVKNKGTWPSLPSNVSFSYIKGLDSKNLALVPLKGLQPGVSTNVYYNWNTTGLEFWNYGLWVHVDPDSSVPDANRANNQGNKTLTLKAKSDLMVSALNMTVGGRAVSSVHRGEIAVINPAIGNNGTKPSAQTTVAIYLDSSSNPLVTMKLFSLIVGGHQVLPYIWDTSSVTIGNHTFKVVVDPINNNTELDKDNNVRSITVTVLAPVGEVDMVVLAVSRNPLSPYVGDHVVITAAIRNNGTAKAINATVLFSYIINASNIGFDDQVTASISPGETVTLNSTWTTGTLAPGNYVLNITIDPLNELHERNRSNNYRTMATSLQPKVWPGTPNLRISSVITDPQKPEEGKKVKVLVTIKNTGDRDATSVRVVLFVDGVELGSQTLTTPITKNGGSQVAYFNWTPKLGLHEVKAQVYIGTSAMPDDVSSKVIKASEPSATGGSYIPVLLIIIILIIIAIALVAMGRTGGAASDSVDEGQEDEGTGEEE